MDAMDNDQPEAVGPETVGPETPGHATPDDLFRRFEALGISVTTQDHDPVFTVEESRHLRGLITGGHCKSLFLRNKRKEMWLVVCDEDRTVDLKRLGERLDAGRLSFGSADRLKEVLGVVPGSVTPFALINDRSVSVTPVLDAGMMENAVLNYHPLVNDRTTSIRREDLLKFIEACGHTPHIVDLDAD